MVSRPDRPPSSGRGLRFVPPPPTGNLRRSLRFGMVLIGALLATLGAAGYFSINGLVLTNRQLADRHEIHGQITALLSLTKDLQAAEQAFVLTGLDTWLEPYKVALHDVDSAARRLEETARQRGMYMERLVQLGPLMEELRSAIKELVEVRKEKGLEGVMPLIKSGRGEQAMNNLRRLELEIAEDDRVELLARRQASEERARNAVALIGGTSAAALLLSLLAFNLLLRSINQPVHESVRQLSSASAQILSSTTQQASSVQQQAAMVAETVATVDQVVRTSDQSMQRARAVSDLSQRSLEIGKAGRKAVEDAVSGMAGVKEHVESIAQAISALAEQSQAIGDITNTVKDLAEQTNLLAINAAIEASRAGEVGKGFGVVAAEVKALADQSKKATTQVRQILARIRRATNSSVTSITDGTKCVSETIQKINQAGEMIRSLTEMISSSAQASSQISVAAAQQTTGMSQIHQAMQQLQDVARQNTVSMTQLDELARDLSEVGARLEKLVGV